FSQIERLDFSGPDGNDHVTGGKYSDVIAGAGGNDVIRAGKGDDTVIDTWGTIDADGGDGTDTIRFTGTTFGHEYGNTTLDANAGAINAGAGTSGTFSNFENLVFFAGPGTDAITGFLNGTNTMYGG